MVNDPEQIARGLHDVLHDGILVGRAWAHGDQFSKADDGVERSAQLLIQLRPKRPLAGGQGFGGVGDGGWFIHRVFLAVGKFFVHAAEKAADWASISIRKPDGSSKLRLRSFFTMSMSRRILFLWAQKISAVSSVMSSDL